MQRIEIADCNAFIVLVVLINAVDGLFCFCENVFIMSALCMIDLYLRFFNINVQKSRMNFRVKCYFSSPNVCMSK